MLPFRPSGLCSSAGNWSHHCAAGAGWGRGGSTGSRWGQVTSRITSELRAGFQLSGTLWRSDLEATFMCFFGDKEGRAGCGVNRIALGIELKFHPSSQRAATLSLHLAGVQRPLHSFLFLFFQRSDKWLQIYRLLLLLLENLWNHLLFFWPAQSRYRISSLSCRIQTNNQ